MAIIYLKSGRSEADKASDDLRIRATVEATLTKIEKEGDAGVRALSLQFDNFERPDFRLSPSEITALMQKVSTRDMTISNLPKHKSAGLRRHSALP